MSKNISIAIFIGLSVASGYFFGTICRRLGQSFELLLTPSGELLVQVLWVFLASAALQICAGVVAALVRPERIGYLVFVLMGVAILIGWEISIPAGILISIFTLVGILSVVGVRKELDQRIIFSVRAISDAQGLLLISLFLLASASLYRGVEAHIEEHGLQIPEAYTEFFLEQLEKRIDEQVPPDERQEALADLQAEFQGTMDEFVENTIKPYQQFIPLGVVFGVFMSLVTVTRFLTWIPAGLMKLIFVLLESGGITKVIHEEMEVERVVLSQ